MALLRCPPPTCVAVAIYLPPASDADADADAGTYSCRLRGQGCSLPCLGSPAAQRRAHDSAQMADVSSPNAVRVNARV
jgi:hypothetical protein